MKILFFILLFTNSVIGQIIETNQVSVYEDRVGQISQWVKQNDVWTFTNNLVSWETEGRIIVYSVKHIVKEHIDITKSTIYKCKNYINKEVDFYLGKNYIVVDLKENNNLLLVYKIRIKR